VDASSQLGEREAQDVSLHDAHALEPPVLAASADPSIEFRRPAIALAARSAAAVVPSGARP